ncbi:hypothetical protein SEA_DANIELLEIGNACE_71 [Arthrobacter phage DanielleIgnace]|nr:hypothetical protein SEA_DANIELLEIGNACE_71 [Arthrobacter phage DanielleIgnace]
MPLLGDWEVEELITRFDDEESLNYKRAAEGLDELIRWTNRNSDGWGYWQLPGKSAQKLMERLNEGREEQRRGWSTGQFKDLTEDEFEALFKPIRNFLKSREIEDPDSILFPPPPVPVPDPVEITVYLTGDEDGPDLLGLVYDLQDDAMESARENDRTAWQVKALLLPGTAIKLESDSDGS